MSLSEHHDVIAITQSYQHAAEIFVRHVLKIIGTALVPNIVTLLLLLTLRRSFTSLIIALAERDPFVPIVLSPIVLLAFLFLVIIVVQLLGNIALTYIVVHHERTEIVNAYEHALVFFWRFLKLGLALFFVTILGYLCGIFIMMITGIILGRFNIDMVTDAFTWLSLLPLVAGSIFSIFFIFAGYDIIDRDVKVTEGLTRSFQLVRGHLFAVLVRVGLLYAATGVIAFTLQLLPWIGNFITLVIVAPFAVLYLAILYNNLKNLKTS